MYIAIMVSLAAIASIGCVRYPWLYIPVYVEYMYSVHTPQKRHVRFMRFYRLFSCLSRCNTEKGEIIPKRRTG